MMSGRISALRSRALHEAVALFAPASITGAPAKKESPARKREGCVRGYRGNKKKTPAHS